MVVIAGLCFLVGSLSVMVYVDQIIPQSLLIGIAITMIGLCLGI